MCGLSAIAAFGTGTGTGTGTDLGPALRAMHDRIPHRGPDGEGFAGVDGAWTAELLDSPADLEREARLGLAFRWLKIQDFDREAAQPMVSPDGRYWLIFNGEIYNFQRLREELGVLGHQFRTVGDTEVLLAALTEWGIDAFARLTGMWAILLYDVETRVLTVSRDRFGIKPLFYRIDPGRIAFASEVKQLVEPGATANRPAVARFVLGMRPDSEETFFEGVLAVPAGTCAQIDLADAQCDLEFVPYWSLEPVHRAGASFADNAAELERILRETVRDHLLAQAPVGILLSGGLDSSLVTALASAERKDEVPTFSMIPSDAAPRYDESRYIDAVARHSGVANQKAQFSPEWLKANLARVTMAQEQPVAGMAVAAQYRTFELAAAHDRRVVLDGQGADELFGGYPRHQLVWLRDLARRGRIWSAGVNFIRILLRDPRFLSDLWRSKVVPRLRRPGRPRSPALLRADAPPMARNGQGASLDATLRGDVFGGNLYAVLAVTDRNAMAHAIEARVPFVDPRIAEFAFGLPDRDRLGAGLRKRILRAVARDRIPVEVTGRSDRIGFGVPVDAWLRTHFVAEIETLRTAPWLDGALVSRQAVDRRVSDFLEGQSGLAGEIWRLIAIDCWVRTYAVSGL